MVEVPYSGRECLYEALKMKLEPIKNEDKFISDNDSLSEDLAQKWRIENFLSGIWTISLMMLKDII